MRILFLTQYFPPEIGAPQVRISELMKRMVGLGHRVTILTAMPNYPKGEIFPAYRGQALKVETLEGMRVLRTWIYPKTGFSLLRRSASQISFAASSALLGPWISGRQDLVLVGSPPLFLALSAFVVSRVLRCSYVAVVADLWPEVAIETGMLRSRVGIRVARWLEAMFYRKSLAVLTQTAGQACDIQARFPGIRVEVLSGAVETGLFSPDLRSESVRREFRVEGKIGVLYAGLHGFAQGLEVVLDAAARLRHRADIRFVMIGDGTLKRDLMARSVAMDLSNLEFYGSVPRDRMPAILASMDIALVPLRRGVPRATIPSKLYEIMASGLPAVVAAEGEAHDMVRDEKIGIALGPGEDAGVALAVETLADDPHRRWQFGARAVALARVRFDRQQASHRLNRLLSELLQPVEPRPPGPVREG